MKIDDLDLKKKIKKAIQINPDLNQKVVAGKVGCSEGFLSLFLNGERDGDFSLLIKIAKATGIDVIEGDGYTINVIAGTSSELGLNAKAGANKISKKALKQQTTSSGTGLEVITGEKNGQFDPSTTEYLRIISRFRHKEWAQKMNSLLLVIEKDPVHRETIERIVKAIAQQIKSQDQAVNDHE